MVKPKKPPFPDFDLAVHPRHKVTNTPDRWWTRYNELKLHLEQNGYSQISNPLSSWMSANRKKWREGGLSNEQVMALREIDFPFTVDHKHRSRKGNQRGVKLDFVLSCVERLNGGQTLSKEDQESYERAMKEYECSYRNGQLAERTAQRLGIT